MKFFTKECSSTLQLRYPSPSGHVCLFQNSGFLYQGEYIFIKIKHLCREKRTPSDLNKYRWVCRLVLIIIFTRLHINQKHIVCIQIKCHHEFIYEYTPIITIIYKKTCRPIYDQFKWGTTFIRAIENKTPIRSRRTNTSIENYLSELSLLIIG